MHPIITNIINLWEATTHDLDELTAGRQKRKRLESPSWPIITAESTGCLQSLEPANSAHREFSISHWGNPKLYLNPHQPRAKPSEADEEKRGGSVGNESVLWGLTDQKTKQKQKGFFWFFSNASAISWNFLSFHLSLNLMVLQQS